MSRLSPNMHPILKSDVIELLNAKQIFTVLDFIKTDTKLIEKASRLTFRVGYIKITTLFIIKPRNNTVSGNSRREKGADKDILLPA